jgi:hypothetical protein
MVRLTRLVPTQQIAFGLCCAIWLLLAAGCATPVGVERVGSATVHRELTADALTADTLSASARNVLRRWALSERYDSDPEGAIAALHSIAVDGRGGTDELEMRNLLTVNPGRSRQLRPAEPRMPCRFFLATAQEGPPSW